MKCKIRVCVCVYVCGGDEGGEDLTTSCIHLIVFAFFFFSVFSVTFFLNRVFRCCARRDIRCAVFFFLPSSFDSISLRRVVDTAATRARTRFYIDKNSHLTLRKDIIN